MAEPIVITLLNPSICFVCQRRLIDKRLFDVLAFAEGETLKRNNVRARAWTTTADERSLCTECAKEHSSFRCALCGEARRGQPHESYGQPAEHLYEPCFETKTAKEFAEAD